MGKPIFYTVRRVTVGPRGKRYIETVRTLVTSKKRAIAQAKIARKHAYSWQDIEVVGIGMKRDQAVYLGTFYADRGVNRHG